MPRVSAPADVMRRTWTLIISICLLLGCAVPTRAGGGAGTGPQTVQVPVETGDPQVDMAERYALAVIGQNFDGVTHAASADYYSNPWVRDSFAWGMIPSRLDPSLSAYSGSEIAFWLDHQQPFGGWLTAPKSGYFDETAIFITAVLDAYRVNGKLTTVRSAMPKLERGWHWLAHSYIKPSEGSRVLLYANVPPHVAADWVDQIARTGYATQLEALWYEATRSMSTMEALVGHHARAAHYASFATRIKHDINRLLWTDSAPYVYRAPRVPAFGHYRSWRGPRDYFELDSNFLCVVYGIASPAQADSITDFVQRHARYLLGMDGGSGVPARVVYGDYARADYAGKRNRIGVGIYQSAAWPSLGALVAIALQKTGRKAEARALLARLGEVFVAQGDIREWYAVDGTGHGAPHFQWAARMYVVAIYAVYRGIYTDTMRSTRSIPVSMLQSTSAMPTLRAARSR
jgi:hypothetical protein